MHPLILDLTRALTALALTATTAALLVTGRPVPDPWWPVLVAVISYLYPATRNNHAPAQKKRAPESPQAPGDAPPTVAGLDRYPTPQGGTGP
jgi:hypothetical protein